MTLEKLPEFLRELTEDYHHDYGTICHAVSIAAIAAAWSVDKSPSGGITGFQAGAVMWEFIREWNYSSNKTGLRIIDNDKFLYPQYEDGFQKTISEDVWNGLKKEAAVQIKKAGKEYAEYMDKLKQWSKDVDAFLEKYPDYYDNRKHYDPMGHGNIEQWEAEEKKKESGFEFAPQEPCKPVYKGSPVYDHWETIVAGLVPFGYSVESED